MQQNKKALDSAEMWRFLRFGAVGVLNTCLTFVTFILLRHWQVPVDVANFLSYFAGMVCSFICNKLWVFRSRSRRWWLEAALFFGGAGLCWLLQWGAFRLLLLLLPEAWAQLGGMAVYTLLNYIYNRCVAFRLSPR